MASANEEGTPSGPRYLGITPPISENPPTEADLQSTERLIATLRAHNLYEDDNRLLLRKAVVQQILDLCLDWLTQVGLEIGLDEEQAEDAGITLRTFGSYRLGVHSPDADIDLLCIAPRHCRRELFFTSFCQILSQTSGVEEIFPVPDAFTPVLKFKLRSIQIDMVFVSLYYTILPDPLDVLDEENLRYLDEQGMRSLNGSRVAEMMLKLVPNIEVFCDALRCIKHWAKVRGIYSNVLGFLGGVNWALMVAFICQRYPKAAACTIVTKFFRIYGKWKWPNPILLTAIREDHPDGCFQPVWNPKVNPRDRACLMPIITPAYPAMNSSYNVGEPQLRSMREEIQWGLEVTQAVNEGTKPWDNLFEPSPFFWKWGHYIMIEMIASTGEDHRKWFGWCESRMRQLILSLEQPPTVLCHPFCRPYFRVLQNGIHCTTMFLGLSFHEDTKMVDLTFAIQDFVFKVNMWDLRRAGMDLRLYHKKGNELPDFVFAPGPVRESNAVGAMPLYVYPPQHPHQQVAIQPYQSSTVQPSGQPTESNGNVGQIQEQPHEPTALYNGEKVADAQSKQISMPSQPLQFPPSSIPPESPLPVAQSKQSGGFNFPPQPLQQHHIGNQPAPQTGNSPQMVPSQGQKPTSIMRMPASAMQSQHHQVPSSSGPTQQTLMVKNQGTGLHYHTSMPQPQPLRPTYTQSNFARSYPPQQIQLSSRPGPPSQDQFYSQTKIRNSVSTPNNYGQQTISAIHPVQHIPPQHRRIPSNTRPINSAHAFPRSGSSATNTGIITSEEKLVGNNSSGAHRSVVNDNRTRSGGLDFHEVREQVSNISSQMNIPPTYS